jgi:hypothetical protein
MWVNGQRHVSAALYPRETTHVTHWTRRWVGLRGGIDAEAREKNPLSLPGIEPRSSRLLSVIILVWGSSVSIVSAYRLDDRAIEGQSPAEAKDFSFSLCLETSSGAHPASCPMGTGCPLPGGKSAAGTRP